MIIINPGSGPVRAASEENAIDNLVAFLADLAQDDPNACLVDDEVPPTDRGDGRWRFHIVVHGKVREVDMPGLPLDRVRFMDEPDQNIWDFPRLYVDGSSWIWLFALGVCGDAEEDDE